EDPQEQTVGVLRGIIGAVLVDDQRIGQSTDFDETIPIAARPRQAGSFEAEDGPGAAQADLGGEILEAVATGRGRPRTSLILVDDFDPLLGPSQVAGAAGEVILPGGAGGVLAHLQRGRLADIDQGESVAVAGSDLRGVGPCGHGRTSGGVGTGRWVT